MAIINYNPYDYRFPFDETRLVQALLYFLKKLESDDYDRGRLKLIKLLYLSEREYIKEYAEPFIGGSFCSLPRGPIISEAYNLMKNDIEYGGHLDHDYFQKFIDISDPRKLSINTLDAGNNILNEAIIDIMEEIYKQHGGKDGWDLSEDTHDKELVPEWKDPRKYNSGKLDISISELLEKLDFNEKESEYVINNAKDFYSKALKQHRDISYTDLSRLASYYGFTF